VNNVATCQDNDFGATRTADRVSANAADICIYGGAAGGGKTVGLILEPLLQTFPPFAAPNKEPEIVALASTTPRSSSSRKCLRRVLAAQPDRLKGKIILISGGARGQGAAEARLFVTEGARVIIGDVLEPEGRLLITDRIEPFSYRLA